MTEPKKIKIKKREEQPFGIEKLRRLAEESRSFEEYMEKVIPEILTIKPKMDKGDNSIQAVYKKILSEPSITEESVIRAVADQKGNPSSQLIGLIDNSSTQVRRLSNREDLIILCFAIVACGGSVEQCDELALAGVSDKYHSRELYQLDAREGFFRFVLYWNQRCHSESKQNLMITYSEACDIFDDKVLPNLKTKIDDELEVLEKLLMRDNTESTIITELMELLKVLQTSIEKSNIDLPKKSDDLQQDYLELIEQITKSLPQLESIRKSDFSEDKEQRDLFSEFITQLKTLPVFIQTIRDELSSATASHQDKYKRFSDGIAEMLNTLKNFLNSIDANDSQRSEYLSSLLKYLQTIKASIKESRLDLSEDAILLRKKYEKISEEVEKNLKVVCTLLFRINDKDGEKTTLLTEFFNVLKDLREKVEKESMSASKGLVPSSNLKKGCKSILDEIGTDEKKIQFILDLMENLKMVKSSEGHESMDVSRSGKYLQNIRKRYSRGEDNNNPMAHQCLTTSMHHNTSAWVSEVKKLVDIIDLDQDSSFEKTCEIYTDMAGNFVRDKDWTAVSIIIHAMCSERYKVNYRYYMTGKSHVKPKIGSEENTEDSENNPNQFRREKKNAKESKADEEKQFILTDAPDFRVSRAILPEKVLSEKVEGTIGRLVNPKIRFLSTREDTEQDEQDEQEDEDLLIPDESIKGDKSESVTKLVSMCGLFSPNASDELNGVVSTTKRQSLLRFAIACNYTSQSDYETILGLSGKNQFILTNKRESFVLSILVWISIKYKAENYVKYSVLETVRYAEIILLYYFAKKRNEEKTSSVSIDEKRYSEIAVFDLNHYDINMYFYSLVCCIMDITKPIDFDSEDFNVYSYLLSGYEIRLPFINYNNSFFPKSPDSITDSEWENVCVFINQTLESLIIHFSEFRENFAEKKEGKAFTLDMDQYLLCVEVLNYCEELDHYFKNQKRFNETFQLIKKLRIETNTLDKLFNEVFQGIHTSDETEDNN